LNVLRAPLILPHPDTELIDAVYDQLGPIPLLCFDKVQSWYELKIHCNRISEIIDDMSMQEYERLVAESGNHLGLEDGWHKICLIRRSNNVITHADLDTISQLVQIMPITDFIRSLLTNRFRNLDRSEQIRLYKRFARLPSTRGMTGNLFEGYCQQRFQIKISIKFLPMVCLSDKRKGKAPQGANEEDRKCKPRWHSSHSVLPDDELEAKRPSALRQLKSLDIRPSHTREYQENGFKIETDVLYIPSKDNKVALDLFILHRGVLYIFQFASGKVHLVKRGLISFLTKCSGYSSRDNWRFICIIPDDSEVLKCLVPKSLEFAEGQFFSSTIALEDEEHNLVSIVQHHIQGWWKV
jgi:hypothetical protein